MQIHSRVIIIHEDSVLFVFFIYAVARIRDNLLNWCLLCLVILGDINGFELFPTSTVLCKEIIDRNISELKLDVLYLERGIQGFYALLGIKHSDNVAII
jgi:hypothetical protein